jgi:hypothetical protein
MTWVAFGMGFIIGLFTLVLIMGLCVVMKIEKPDFEEVDS